MIRGKERGGNIWCGGKDTDREMMSGCQGEKLRKQWHWVSGYGEKREGGEECNPDGLQHDNEHNNHMCSISSADYAEFDFDGIQLQYIRQTEG